MAYPKETTKLII